MEQWSNGTMEQWDNGAMGIVSRMIILLVVSIQQIIIGCIGSICVAFLQLNRYLLYWFNMCCIIATNKCNSI